MRRTGIGVLVSVTILSGAIFSIEPTCAAGSRAFCGTWLSVCNRTCPGGAGTCGGVWSQARRVPYFRLLLFQHAGASMRGKCQGSGRNHPEQRQNAESRLGAGRGLDDLATRTARRPSRAERRGASTRSVHNPLKSSGTSPNFLITLASPKSPVAGSPVRLNATAPRFP